MKNKKGQVSSLPTTVTIIIMALIFIGVGLFIVQELYDFDEFTDESATIVNESGLSVNSSTSTVATSGTSPGFNSFSIIQCYCNYTGNSSTGMCDVNTTLPVANITTSADTGMLKNATANQYDFVMCTYSYKYGTSSFEGINSTLEAFSEIPEFMNLMILVVMLGIIIAILVGIGGKKVGTGA